MLFHHSSLAWFPHGCIPVVVFQLVSLFSLILNAPRLAPPPQHCQHPISYIQLDQCFKNMASINHFQSQELIRASSHLTEIASTHPCVCMCAHACFHINCSIPHPLFLLAIQWSVHLKTDGAALFSFNSCIIFIVWMFHNLFNKPLWKGNEGVE